MDPNMDMSNMNMMMTPTPAVSQTDIATAIVGSIIYFVVMLVLVVINIIAMWKIFTKAGQAGWKAIIPIYSSYIMLKIINRPGWWILLFFIPLVNIVIALIMAIELGRAFGKSTLFSVIMLFFLSFIGYLILGFGGAKYSGPGGAVTEPQAPTPTEPPTPALPETPPVDPQLQPAA